MSDEDDSTNPEVQLPPVDPAEVRSLDSDPPRSSPPLPPPPRMPSSDTDRPARPAWPAANAPAQGGPGVRKIQAPPPGAVARPIAQAAAARSTADRRSPTRASAFPARAGTPSRPPPPIRRASKPPSKMPKPTDPPPPPGAMSPPQRQRLAQMETMLDQARSTMARQKNEIDELRGKLEARDERIEAAIASLEAAPTKEGLEALLQEAEQRRVALARELHDRVDAASRGVDGIDGLESRVAVLEEGSEAARIRMRLERVGHQLQGLEVRVEGMEETLEELRREDEEAEAQRRRLERVESLFEELTEEVKQLRRDREASDLTALESRMDDVEGLLLKSTSLVDQRRETLEARVIEVEALLARLEPPAASSGAEVEALAARLAEVEALAQRLREQPAPPSAAEVEPAELEALRARVAKAEGLAREASSGIDATRLALSAQIAKVEEIANRAPPPPPPASDDLTQLKGVGPKYARLLRAAGVTELAQIATWDDEEIARIAKAIGIKAARIKKLGWVETAKEL